MNILWWIQFSTREIKNCGKLHVHMRYYVVDALQLCKVVQQEYMLHKAGYLGKFVLVVCISAIVEGGLCVTIDRTLDI